MAPNQKVTGANVVAKADTRSPGARFKCCQYAPFFAFSFFLFFFSSGPPSRQARRFSLPSVRYLTDRKNPIHKFDMAKCPFSVSETTPPPVAATLCDLAAASAQIYKMPPNKGRRVYISNQKSHHPPCAEPAGATVLACDSYLGPAGWVAQLCVYGAHRQVNTQSIVSQSQLGKE